MISENLVISIHIISVSSQKGDVTLIEKILQMLCDYLKRWHSYEKHNTG